MTTVTSREPAPAAETVGSLSETVGVPRPIRRSRVVHSWTIGVVLIGATVYGLLERMATLGLAMLAMNLVVVDQPNVGEVALWAMVATVAACWLAIGAGRMRPVSGAWLRPSLW